ncbi:MAG: M14 metallopeptidase family protein [Chitinophagaceae bacterium]
MLKSIFVLLSTTLLFLVETHAQTIPSPKDHFGFNIGDNYKLANYTQTEAYFKKLASASDRCKLVDIGITEEGRHQYMMIVSSPGNIKNLDHYKDISQKLARAENLTDEQAHTLASEGKAIVWVDGGLHATEVVATQQLIEIIYQVVSRKDTETVRLLEGVILLFTHANPDGQELVSDWYMKDVDSLKRKTNIPRLYEKYIGHDNNRDFFMMNMKESQNMSRQQYIEWMPQIIYNHHQAGPQGSVVAGPPYRDPFNYVFDPLLVTSLDAVGAAMNNRLNLEGKPGYTQRAGSVYSTWWNGGLRTTAYFHNMIGLLTEIIGSPAPTSIPLVPHRLIPNMATTYPVKPQKWSFRQSIDYSVSLNYAVFNYALHQKEDLLYGIYRMGRNSIESGSRDNWILSPKRIDSINSKFRRDERFRQAAANADAAVSTRSDSIPLKYYDEVLKDPKLRDARGYVISADQPDFPTAIKFINALIRSGILVQKATADFIIEGTKYPAGSYIVKTDQAFRPHVIDMFEPQDHPNDFQYPGGPPIRPYDAAGWTLAYEMGIQFQRILEGFDGPFARIPYGEVQSPSSKTVPSSKGGYLISSRANNSFITVNDLLKSGVEVYRLPNSVAGKQERGTFFVPATAEALLEKSSASLGLEITAIDKRPAGALRISPMRIALWDNYGGSIPSGWVRWLMEQFHFPIQLVYAQEINAGNLRSKFDLILFVNGAIPPVRFATVNTGERNTDVKPDDIPAQFRPWLGRVTADTSVPQLKKFMEAGGTVVTIGSSTNLVYHLGLPVRNALVEMIGNTERPLPGEKFYIPGSILRMSLDSTQTAAWGMPATCDVYFDASPAFKISPEAISRGQVKPLAWYSSNKPLRSGWAWGQEYLQDAVAAFVASLGSGKLYAFGPEIMFRGQTHGTFKLFFNTLYK